MTTLSKCSAMLIATLMLVPAPVMAKGCIKGAIVGGIAGHMAGGHGAMGAAAGCAIGHHNANKGSGPQGHSNNAPKQ
jgi:hypothetical protein